MIYVAKALGADDAEQTLLLYLANNTGASAQHRLIGQLAREVGRQDLLVKLGKIALGKGVFIAEMAYPSLPYFHEAPAEERPFLTALARQESEFNPKATSHVGALGLMQLMPTTAKAVAGQIGVSYSAARLIDPHYNVQLGTYYIEHQVEHFSGSYIMALAAYNAGATRVQSWVAQYGDPRDPHIDAVDWVEKIPFAETRNYVQRIMEGMMVYRAHGQGDVVRPSHLRRTLGRHEGA
jgi:soluble lytic murein transglycosylase